METLIKTHTRRLLLLFCLPLTLMIWSSCTKHDPNPQDNQQEFPDVELPDSNTIPNPLVAKKWKPGQVFFSENNWVECIVGDFPLVLTAPHGGDIRPVGVPDRNCPDAVTVKDVNTQELVREIAAELYKTYGVRPYVVINRLHRIKLDPNREVEEASCGNEIMKGAWNHFHNYVDSAVSTAAYHHDSALFVDVHGHTGSQVELGYSLSGANLRSLASGNSITSLIPQSSLVNYMANNSPAIFQDLVMGDAAFGTMLEKEGIPAMPSIRRKAPGSGESFFSGGYISRRYGAIEYPGVYGFQMECHRSIRDERQEFVQTFAKLIIQYMGKTTL